MRVLVCGDRNWINRDLIYRDLFDLPRGEITIIHGAARGADSIAGEVAKELGYKVEAYPADWEKHGRAAGPIRNKKMLEEGKPNLVLAFHNDLESSKGTKHMVKIAREAKVPVLVRRDIPEVT